MKENTFFQRNKETILGILMVAFALFYLVSASAIETGTAVKVNARAFPYGLGLLIAFLGLVQIRAGLRVGAAIARKNARDGVAPVAVSAAEWRHVFPVVGIFIIIIAYILFLESAGFVVATSLCIFLQILLLTPKGGKRFLLSAFVAVASSVIIYVAFRKGLDLSLPEGLLSGIF